MTQEIARTVGETVKKAREEKKLTQNELAEMIKMSRNYISDIECGRYIPSTETLILIAKTLEIDLNLLKNDGNTV